MELLEHRELLSVTVNTLVDENDGVGLGGISLRDAIAAANPGDTINFSTSNPDLNGGRIVLEHGDIFFAKALTIDASMLSQGLTVDASGSDPDHDNSSQSTRGNGVRIFDIADNSNGTNPELVTIKSLTFTGGDVGTIGDADGGAIKSTARLAVFNCVFTGNSAGDSGGAIWIDIEGTNDPNNQRPALEALHMDHCTIQNNFAVYGGGVATLSATNTLPTSDTFLVTNDSTISGNTAAQGGGIYANLNGATLTFENSTASGNTAYEYGGGIGGMLGNAATLTIEGANLLGNAAADGGALRAHLEHSNLSIHNNTTVAENHAVRGGGISLDTLLNGGASTIDIADSTITGNTTYPSGSDGGGIYARFDGQVHLTLTNTTISKNSAYGSGGGIRLSMPYATELEGSGDGNVVELSKVTIVGNTARGVGGGFCAGVSSGGQSLSILDSAIRDNTSGTTGGGACIFLHSDAANLSKVMIGGTEFSDNTAAGGGGIAILSNESGGQVGVYNTTISGNKATSTGGIGGGVLMSTLHAGTTAEAAFDVDARFVNVTITNNTADVGAGVYSLVPSNSASLNRVRLQNSIVSANNTASFNASNLYGSFDVTNTTYNILGTDDNGTGAIFDYASHSLAILNTTNNYFTNSPGLSLLEFNGGPTRTHRPFVGSQAINHGSNALDVIPFTTTHLSNDQRGDPYPRRDAASGLVDIGALEVSPLTGAPHINNVVLRGLSWNSNVYYAYSSPVLYGDQHRPMYIQGADRIEIHFDRPVAIPAAQQASMLSILTDMRAPIQQTITSGGYDSNSYIATWYLSSPLGRGKYALKLSGVTDANSVGVDGHWDNLDGQFTVGSGGSLNILHTCDNFDDDPGHALVSGNGTAGSGFEFHLSVLPGDYDQDGIVTEADTGIGTVKDGDGDGVVEDGVHVASTDDIDLATLKADTQLPYRVVSGDFADSANPYFDQDLVNFDDYMIWRAHFDEAVARWTIADASGNSQVDAADYVPWRADLNKYSAWYIGILPTTTPAVVVDFDHAPRVANVTISGHSSTHAPYSFATNVGSGQQLATVPVGGADTISITFNEDVHVDATFLRVVGLRRYMRPAVLDFNYDIASMTATWRFATPLQSDEYLIKLSDSVTDLQGNHLDGEWVNPVSLSTTNSLVSHFPSGNGTAGGEFAFVFTYMQGDLDRDLTVGDDNDRDVATAKLYMTGAEWDDGDMNGDGVVNSLDFDWLSVTYGADWQSVAILGDYNHDHALTSSDQSAFDTYYANHNAAADVNHDGSITQADHDAFYDLLGCCAHVSLVA